MFRNNDDFDDVSNYKRNKEQDNMNSGNFFSRDGEYINPNGSNNTNENKSNKQTSNTYTTGKSTQTNYGRRQKSKSPLVVILVIVFIAMIGFIGSVVGNSDYEGGYEGLESDKEYLSDYESYINKTTAINAKEFVKQYETAKKNRIKYNRLKEFYISGNYSSNYVVNERYLEYFDVIDESIDTDDEYDKKVYLSCLQNEKSSYSDDKEKTIKILSCGISGRNSGIDTYPADFVKYEEDRLSDYSTSNTESMDRYYINGFFYTKEYCDAVAEFAKKH